MKLRGLRAVVGFEAVGYTVGVVWVERGLTNGMLFCKLLCFLSVCLPL